jgi:hypothetical protein
MPKVRIRIAAFAKWPSIERPDQIGDAIIARLGSV